MAKRQYDGKRIYNESWDRTTRDAFFWLLGVGADSLGMQAEKQATLAEAISASRRDAKASLDVLTGGIKPCLVRYIALGKPFLVFRKWQDHQRITFKVEPTCPLPPCEALASLSEATCELLVRNFQVTDELLLALARTRGTLTPTLINTIKKDLPVSGGNGARAPRAKKAPDPNQPSAPNFQPCVEAYCEGYLGAVGTKTQPGGRGMKALRAKLIEVPCEPDPDDPGRYFDAKWPLKVQAVIEFVAGGHDPFVGKKVPALCEIIDEVHWPKFLARAQEYYRTQREEHEDFPDTGEGIP